MLVRVGLLGSPDGQKLFLASFCQVSAPPFPETLQLAVSITVGVSVGKSGVEQVWAKLVPAVVIDVTGAGALAGDTAFPASPSASGSMVAADASFLRRVCAGLGASLPDREDRVALRVFVLRRVVIFCLTQ